MKPIDKYKSASGFRMAVKSKLNEINQKTGQDIQNKTIQYESVGKI